MSEQTQQTPAPAAEYVLTPSEVQHLRRLTASRNSVRLRLLEAIEYQKQAEDLVRKTREEVDQQSVQLASATAMVAANRDEPNVQEWEPSPDCTRITRIKQ